MTQHTVKDIYLRVIEKTIEDSRKGFMESGEESILDSLDMLAERWRSRVLAFDFTEDPGMIPKASGSSRSASAAASAASTAAAAAAPAAPPPLPAPVDTGAPAKAEPVLSGQQQRPYVAPVYRGVPPPPVAAPMESPAYPPEFHPGHAAPPAKAEPVLPPAPDGRVPQGDAPGDERPAKRARTENGNVSHKLNSTHDDDDHIGAEDLDSSGDSDVQSAGSDPEADNYILAQHDRVRKGTGKWKVQLKEGIAHINGRDYLFNKATCDLDW